MAINSSSSVLFCTGVACVCNGPRTVVWRSGRWRLTSLQYLDVNTFTPNLCSCILGTRSFYHILSCLDSMRAGENRRMRKNSQTRNLYLHLGYETMWTQRWTGGQSVAPPNSSLALLLCVELRPSGLWGDGGNRTGELSVQPFVPLWVCPGSFVPQTSFSFDSYIFMSLSPHVVILLTVCQWLIPLAWIRAEAQTEYYQPLAFTKSKQYAPLWDSFTNGAVCLASLSTTAKTDFLLQELNIKLQANFKNKNCIFIMLTLSCDLYFLLLRSLLVYYIY